MKMPLFIEKSFLGQTINKLKRRKRGSKKKNKKLKNTKIFPSFKEISSRVPIFLRVGFTLALLVGILSYPIYTYLSITTSPLESRDIEEKPRIYNPDYFHTAIYGYSENDGYKYIDYIAIVAHGDQTKIVQVSPIFTSQKYQNVTLRSFLNKIESDEDMSQSHKLNDALSTMLGVRVDRYFLFNSEIITNFLEAVPVSADLSKMPFSSEEIYKEEHIQQQSEFTFELFQESFSMLNKFRLFWNLPELSQLVKTDMSRTEFTRFFNKFSTGSSIQVSNIGIEFGNIYDSPDATLSIEPNYIIIDEKLLGTLSNIDLIAEQAELEIYNATNIRGYASSISRELQNQGINVVKLGNYFETEKQTQLHLRDENDFNKYRNTIIAIQQSLRGNLKIEVGEYKYNQTGDLILVLAE